MQKKTRSHGVTLFKFAVYLVKFKLIFVKNKMQIVSQKCFYRCIIRFFKLNYKTGRKIERLGLTALYCKINVKT